jgi:hypothetical protein
MRRMRLLKTWQLSQCGKIVDSLGDSIRGKA